MYLIFNIDKCQNNDDPIHLYKEIAMRSVFLVTDTYMYDNHGSNELFQLTNKNKKYYLRDFKENK